MNQLATIPANHREQLVAQQQQLNLQLENLNQIMGENGEQTLLEAISQQHWYSFKNKREIVFDRRTGLLFPNFNYIPFIKYNDWDNERKLFELHGIGKKRWVALHTIFYREGNQEQTWHTYPDEKFSFPKKFSSLDKKEEIVIFTHYHDSPRNYEGWLYYKNFNIYENCTDYQKSRPNNANIFPTFHILNNSNILPSNPRLKIDEKAKIILDFFIEQDWIPNFESFLEQGKDINGDFLEGSFEEKYDFYIEDEDDFQERLAEAQQQCDEYNRIFDAYYNRIKLQKQLVELEAKISDLPEPEPENLFTSDFDYRVEIQNYHLAEINTSVWQYSLSAQQWINNLLTQIDSWESSHQHLLANALGLNTTLTKKLPISLNLNDTEKEILNTRHTDLQQRLNFSLEPLRSTLIDLLQQNQQIETTLQTTHSLTALAELEQQPRPSFTLLAEHTAKRCTQTLKKLEWLENSLDFVNSIVKSEQQSIENYMILLDKYQQDLLQIGMESSIESEEVSKWFAEWRQERLQILQQWQPLIQAGLNNLIPQHTVLDTLQCLEQYQQNLDKFYLGKRLGIHTTYAFQANGHRQEKLEKEQEITKLVHQFMQNLEKVIFSAKTTAQKIWLVRFSEVWQQGIVQEIIAFLSNEELLDRGDIAQIVSEEMRKIQQQSLAACLQDAKTYSAALTQQEKDFATLMFKMRKALQK